MPKNNPPAIRKSFVGGFFCKKLLQLQQLGLPFGFRSRILWLDNFLTKQQYETKHSRGNHYAKKERN
ncbi:MAG: hypothetical protein COU31_02920 [Candidatus Magasanikbacteria bacterium CG10_big_fil_rev_8_21_14_0_10_40_10]|uniref:Uncharacterized protein n=1 Tax=Candidatus Magasanikbacteria bacterium CG10_big_fil_rev_8_21_14_0_10_40_10 TaxID=1974648 RepID=A0A2M6W3V8_9BACT|nr:MAG: hypothetical protein COU31_02920 [Candidatus Magasanikbacteria bacterium CG10_big_fil_rev_8_21_14_0_10_40_10]